jgi:glycosyltransferase involved in cell wall biosynthesis
MKVLIVHNKYRQYGGEDTVVQQETKAYEELGHTVKTHVESNSELGFFDLLFSAFNLSSYFKLKREVKEFDPDVVHVHNFIFKLSPSIFWAVGKKPKLFLTLHNYRFLCPSGTLFYQGEINNDYKSFWGRCKNVLRGVYQNSVFKTAILHCIYQFNFILGSFRKIDRYVFLTEFSKNVHLQQSPKRFAKNIVKPNFLFNVPEIGVKNKTIDVLFVGRFTTEKGLLNILPALIANTQLNIHLAGGGPDEEAIVKQINGTEHITLHGEINRSQVYDLMTQTKFLIFPSIWYEGMPMTIIEAYASKVPVIARKLGAMSNMILHEKTGLHYSNITELKTLLSKLSMVDSTILGNNAHQEYMTKYSKEVGLMNLSKLLSEKVH